MTPCKTTKTWARTGHRNLLKHQQSGKYYARTFAGGKEIWKSLKTSHRSVAEARLAEFVKDHRKRRSNAFTAVSRFYGLSSQNAESSTGSNSFM
jgi:hypothetical protein